MVGVDWGMRPSFGRLAGVDQIAELFAGLEVGHALGRDRDGGPGFGVTASAGLALAGAKAPEASDLDLVVGLEGGDDGVEESVDDDLAVTAGEVSKGGNVIDEFGFRHAFQAPFFESASEPNREGMGEFCQRFQFMSFSRHVCVG